MLPMAAKAMARRSIWRPAETGDWPDFERPGDALWETRTHAPHAASRQKADDAAPAIVERPTQDPISKSVQAENVSSQSVTPLPPIFETEKQVAMDTASASASAPSVAVEPAAPHPHSLPDLAVRALVRRAAPLVRVKAAPTSDVSPTAALSDGTAFVALDRPLAATEALLHLTRGPAQRSTVFPIQSRPTTASRGSPLRSAQGASAATPPGLPATSAAPIPFPAPNPAQAEAPLSPAALVDLLIPRTAEPGRSDAAAPEASTPDTAPDPEADFDFDQRVRDALTRILADDMRRHGLREPGVF